MNQHTHPNLSGIIAQRDPARAARLIGMVHVGALPGTPFACRSIEQIEQQAVAEARQIEDAGFDAIIVENMHDAPYVHGDKLGPEIVAAMTRLTGAVRNSVQIPVGLQILSGGNRHSIAVAHINQLPFIRCENFVFAHIADEGLLAEAEAGGCCGTESQSGPSRSRCSATSRRSTLLTRSPAMWISRNVRMRASSSGPTGSWSPVSPRARPRRSTM